jgi:hypothetical protein
MTFKFKSLFILMVSIMVPMSSIKAWNAFDVVKFPFTHRKTTAAVALTAGAVLTYYNRDAILKTAKEKLNAGINWIKNSTPAKAILATGALVAGTAAYNKLKSHMSSSASPTINHYHGCNFITPAPASGNENSNNNFSQSSEKPVEKNHIMIDHKEQPNQQCERLTLSTTTQWLNDFSTDANESEKDAQIKEQKKTIDNQAHIIAKQAEEINRLRLLLAQKDLQMKKAGLIAGL